MASSIKPHALLDKAQIQWGQEDDGWSFLGLSSVNWSNANSKGHIPRRCPSHLVLTAAIHCDLEDVSFMTGICHFSWCFQYAVAPVVAM